ncbi:hypothetical protein Daus18300_008647 [Diaporthe australafricana]|uniref:Uncharacterized protein n=1 Tax=Diaporthe australafricana TaxID=127596 RepID=A0ABR3WHN7_9PEZI
MTITSTPTHLPHSSVGAGPPGDSVLAVTGTVPTDIVLVETISLDTVENDSGAVTGTVPTDSVLVETTSVDTVENDSWGVRLDVSALSEGNDVWIDKVLELPEGCGTLDSVGLAAAQESRELADGPVEPGGNGVFAGGAPYVGNITDDGPAGVDANELPSLLAEGALETSVADSDGVLMELLVSPLPDEPVLDSVAALGARLDASTEVLVTSVADIIELEAIGAVTLVCGSEPGELATTEELAACESEVAGAELRRAVSEDSVVVVVVISVDAPIESTGPLVRLGNAGNEGPGRLVDDGEALSDTISEDKETELVTSPVDEPESPVDELEGPPTAPLDVELAGPGTETLKLSVLLRLGTLRDPDTDTAPVDEADTDPPFEVGKTEPTVPEAELPGGPFGNDDSVYGPAVDDVSAKDRLTLIVVVSVLDIPEGAGLAVAELGPDDEEYNTVEDDSRVDTTGVRVVRKLLLVMKVVPMEMTVADESDALVGTADEELTGPMERLVYVLDTMEDEPNVQVSTSVVVKSVIWEVE